MNELIRWFFTESRLREANPFCRFETEMLDALDEIDVDIDSDERRRIKKLVIERADQIFESDLSWGQNIYSRENLRWISFIAGYALVMRESQEDYQPFLLSLEAKIQTFCHIRFFSLWFLVARSIIFLRKILPRKSFMRCIRISTFLELTYLPFTTPTNWTYGYDSLYERFFKAHSCQEIGEFLAEEGDRLKRLSQSMMS